jgi:ribosomal protein S18 acetylase RimI-like enzyme
MIENSKNFIVRDMSEKDLPEVANIHRDCFPSNISMFTALPEHILMNYYRMFISEGSNSSAAVVEMVDTGVIAGYTCGTREPGIRRRFVNRYPLQLATALLWTALRSSEFRQVLLHKKGSENTLFLRGYDELLHTAGVPDPNGREDLNMGIAIHSAYRGGGKASALLDYYCRRVFEMSNAKRVRGAILKVNVASLTLVKRLGWEIRDVTVNQVSNWKDRDA